MVLLYSINAKITHFCTTIKEEKDINFQSLK